MLQKAISAFIEKFKPEATYFGFESGQRTAFFVFDMEGSHQCPEVAEALFGTGCDVHLSPCMTRTIFKVGWGGRRINGAQGSGQCCCQLRAKLNTIDWLRLKVTGTRLALPVRHFAKAFTSDVPKGRQLTYVVDENCIRCKIMDCVEVCPVDCFYEGENMLVIHPDECIDCGVCVPECPVDAIKPDTEPGLEKWLRLNAEFVKVWPNITMKKPPPPDSKDWEGKPDKFQFFLPNPGAGD